MRRRSDPWPSRIPQRSLVRPRTTNKYSCYGKSRAAAAPWLPAFALAVTEPDSPAIVVDRVTKSFPESHRFSAWLKHRGPPPRRVALSDVTLQIGRKELFGLLGLNGAGKTTLLKVLCTLALPDKGAVRVDGIDVERNSLAARRRIGYCSGDDRSFYWRLTGRENMELFGTLAGFKGRRLDQRIDEVIREVDLSDDLDRRYVTYSSGMRQRLGVARALLHDPPVLLFDEPTRTVDAKHAENIRHFLRELVDKGGKTVVLATNLVEEAWGICDRVAIIRRGHIVTVQSPRHLSAQAIDKRTFCVLVDRVSDEFVARLRTLQGFVQLSTRPNGEGVWVDVEMEASTATLNQIFRALSPDGVSVRSFHVEQPRPFDIFVKLASDAE